MNNFKAHSGRCQAAESLTILDPRVNFRDHVRTQVALTAAGVLKFNGQSPANPERPTVVADFCTDCLPIEQPVAAVHGRPKDPSAQS